MDSDNESEDYYGVRSLRKGTLATIRSMGSMESSEMERKNDLDKGADSEAEADSDKDAP